MSQPTKIIATWNGPFSWPGYENINGLPKLPKQSGVYLQTFEYKGGYIIYGAGLTRRNVGVRFKQHDRNYLNAEYHVLDTESAKKGVRKLIWAGWTHATAHKKRVEARREPFIKAVRKQLSGFRIFVANLETAGRLHERLESSIMDALYASKSVHVRKLPDKGMQLSRRKGTEPIIRVKNVSKVTLYGLPETLEI